MLPVNISKVTTMSFLPNVQFNADHWKNIRSHKHRHLLRRCRHPISQEFHQKDQKQIKIMEMQSTILLTGQPACTGANKLGKSIDQQSRQEMTATIKSARWLQHVFRKHVLISYDVIPFPVDFPNIERMQLPSSLEKLPASLLTGMLCAPGSLNAKRDRNDHSNK